MRQLQNVVRTVTVMHDGDLVSDAMLPEDIRHADADKAPTAAGGAPEERVSWTSNLLRPLAETEKLAIDAALAAHGGNVTAAARTLDVSPSTIYRKKSAWGEDLK